MRLNLMISTKGKWVKNSEWNLRTRNKKYVNLRKTKDGDNFLVSYHQVLNNNIQFFNDDDFAKCQKKVLMLDNYVVAKIVSILIIFILNKIEDDNSC